MILISISLQKNVEIRRRWSNQNWTLPLRIRSKMMCLVLILKRIAFRLLKLIRSFNNRVPHLNRWLLHKESKLLKPSNKVKFRVLMLKLRLFHLQMLIWRCILAKTKRRSKMKFQLSMLKLIASHSLTPTLTLQNLFRLERPNRLKEIKQLSNTSLSTRIQSSSWISKLQTFSTSLRLN